MAEDYYQRGKIEQPTIGLLAKTCLITAGNVWKRMQVQLKNIDYERKVQQQDPQNYQQRPEFVHISGDPTPQSVASKRPPPFDVEGTKRQLKKEAANLVNTSMTEWGYPTFTPRLDTSSMDGNRRQQRQSQPRPRNQFYYDGDYGISQ